MDFLNEPSVQLSAAVVLAIVVTVAPGAMLAMSKPTAQRHRR
jgi:hypothetical protein